MKLAIVGATGLVGQTFLRLLEERQTPYTTLYLYASKNSAGTKLVVQGKSYTVIETTEQNIVDKEIDVAFFSAGSTVSKQYAPIFASIGALVVDNSSAFRMDDNVPLVVPEVNMNDAYAHQGIIANPNCSTIQSVVPLAVIDRLYSLTRVDYTTYQAVSGSGQKGIDELQRSRNNETPLHYVHPIHNNVLPHIDRFLMDGFTFEEEKMINETQKILHRSDVEVSATCVRVPVEHSHSVSMVIEVQQEVDITTLRDVLSIAKGITVLDDVSNDVYPLPLLTTNTNDVYVGRLRKDRFNPHKLHLFCTADNIRKGAALNGLQIVEEYMKNRA
jgi:aspartate-semialdehyde dehydrogenase